MRNLLTILALAVERLQGLADGLVHPRAAADPFFRPRHRFFIAGCFFAGGAALVVLPLHLALAGPTSLPLTLALAWMLCQWPLALYLSHTGSLDRTIGLSAILFAGFIAAISGLTGGLSSFALFWLVLVPVEAAFSTSRRVIAAVAGTCLALLAAMAFVPPAWEQYGLQSGHPVLISSLGACLYGACLALRIAQEGKTARRIAEEARSRVQVFNACTSEVICRIGADGNVGYLGGPLERLIGLGPRKAGDDWLFQRLHVADRPACLTEIARVRHSRRPAALRVRLRSGASQPGEDGVAEYIWAELQMRLAGETAFLSLNARDGLSPDDVVLAIRDITDQKTEEDASAEARLLAELAGVESNRLWQSAGEELKAPIADIVNFSQLLRKGPESAPGSADHRRDYAERILRTGEEIRQRLDQLLDTAPRETDTASAARETVDLAGCAESCRKLMMPMAIRAGLTLDLRMPANLAPVPGHQKQIRQVLCYVLSHAIRSLAAGGALKLEARAETGGVGLILTVSGTGADTLWASREAEPVLHLVAKTLEPFGGSVQLQRVSRHGAAIILRLPATEGVRFATMTGRAANG